MTCLGVDIGGTKVTLRAEAAGRESCDVTFQWPDPARDARQDIGLLAANVQVLREQWRAPITSVGVAMPAALDTDGHVVTWPNRPAWAGVDVRSALLALFPGAEVTCADDGDLAALAEADAANCRDLVYIGVGTGIGGGIVLDGRLLPGSARGSCEIGHVIVERSGRRCDCGRDGCLQSIASGPATLRRASEVRGHEVAFHELQDAFTANASWARAVIDDACAAIAAVVVSLGELVRPELVPIGGGFAAAFPDYAAMVSRHTARLARPGHLPPPVRTAALGGLSSLYGALLLARLSATAR
jgi:kanosamine 6-kinase